MSAKRRFEWQVLAWVAFGGICAILTWKIFGVKYEFEKPQFFWGLVGAPLLIGLFSWLSVRNPNVMKVSGLAPLPKNSGLNFSLLHMPAMLKTFAAGMLMLVLAQPHSKDSFENITREGIDMVLSIDLSASMLAMDFKPNRLESARKTALEFVQARPDDRFGLVLYEGESFTRVPLTTDHRVVLDAINTMNTGALEPQLVWDLLLQLTDLKIVMEKVRSSYS